jgi:ribosomal subunit interface protein
MDEHAARATNTTALQIVAGIGIPDSERDYAAAMLRRLVQSVQRPVRHAQVVLTLDRNPTHRRSALVEASLDVVGAPVRACVAAADLRQAVDQVSVALARRLDQQQQRVSRRMRPAGSGTAPGRRAAGHPTRPAHPTADPVAPRPAGSRIK